MKNQNHQVDLAVLEKEKDLVVVEVVEEALHSEAMIMASVQMDSVDVKVVDLVDLEIMKIMSQVNANHSDLEQGKKMPMKTEKKKKDHSVLDSVHDEIMMKIIKKVDLVDEMEVAALVAETEVDLAIVATIMMKTMAKKKHSEVVLVGEKIMKKTEKEKDSVKEKVVLAKENQALEAKEKKVDSATVDLGDLALEMMKKVKKEKEDLVVAKVDLDVATMKKTAKEKKVDLVAGKAVAALGEEMKTVKVVNEKEDLDSAQEKKTMMMARKKKAALADVKVDSLNEEKVVVLVVVNVEKVDLVVEKVVAVLVVAKMTGKEKKVVDLIDVKVVEIAKLVLVLIKTLLNQMKKNVNDIFPNKKTKVKTHYFTQSQRV